MASECIITLIHNLHIIIYTEEEDWKLSSQTFPIVILKTSSLSRPKEQMTHCLSTVLLFTEHALGISDTLVKSRARYFPGAKSDYSDRFNEDAPTHIRAQTQIYKIIFPLVYTHTLNKEKKYILFSLEKLS